MASFNVIRWLAAVVASEIILLCAISINLFYLRVACAVDSWAKH